MGGAVSGQEIPSLAQTLNFPSSETDEGANPTGTDTTWSTTRRTESLTRLKTNQECIRTLGN